MSKPVRIRIPDEQRKHFGEAVAFKLAADGMDPGAAAQAAAVEVRGLEQMMSDLAAGNRICCGYFHRPGRLCHKCGAPT